MFRKFIADLTGFSQLVVHGILHTERYKIHGMVKKFLLSRECNLPDSDKKSIKKYLFSRLVAMQSYSFYNEYRAKKVEVFFDNAFDLHYVLHNGRKLFFKKTLGKQAIRTIYNSLCAERDIRSPHSYWAFPINYQADDIVADVGAAEGIFGLDVVEKIKKLYLFEYDKEWIEALYATFFPYKEKVCIVHCYILDICDGVNRTLDDYFLKEAQNEFPTIIKADIEGAEAPMLKGSPVAFSRHVREALICTYHRVNDCQDISNLLDEYNFYTEASAGYFITWWDGYAANISQNIRKALIHGFKRNIGKGLC
jgi:hypothetical protein